MREGTNGEVRTPAKGKASNYTDKNKKEGEKEYLGADDRKKGKGLEKENIPPENKDWASPKRKEYSRRGKESEKENAEDISSALIPYSSPPPPTIGDFLMEALEARGDEQAHEFQEVRRKTKRFPLTNGTREEPRTKGKVQKLCLEWDAQGSR